jgi:hypothetical protein
LFCGYFSGISGSGSRPMTHLPVRSESLVGGADNDWEGG